MEWNARREQPLLAIVGLTFVLALIAWPNSPSEVPTHWNLAGQVDGWAPRAFGLLAAPFGALMVYLVLTFAPRLDPLRDNYIRFAGAYTATRALVLVVLLALQVVIVAAATGRAVRMDAVMHLAVGLMFMGLGILLPRFKPNWLAGIRTPWTLSSDEVWQRTHQVGGRVFIVMGFVVAVASFLGGTAAFRVIAMAAAVAAVGLVAYSYIVWREVQRRG